jgi:hypothetical protein
VTKLSIRQAVDLLHIGAGRPDLSRNPIDHDEGCPRRTDPEARCGNGCWASRVAEEAATG